jgi:hypothetical protein
VIARSENSAKVALDAGVRADAVVTSSDIVFCNDSVSADYRPGIAAALRVDQAHNNGIYLNEITAILDYFEQLAVPVDQTSIEPPMNAEQVRRGYVSGGHPRISIYPQNEMYKPFELRRDAVISSRLHTTLLALLAGNRKILQFQIELNTNKINEILGDMGLTALPVYDKGAVTVRTVRKFIEETEPLEEQLVSDAIDRARQRNEVALDRFEEWLEYL